MLLADDAQRKNEIQPPFRLSLYNSRGGGSGEVEIDKRLVDCVHTIDDVFGVEADCEILAFETDGDFFVDFAVVGVSVRKANAEISAEQDGCTSEQVRVVLCTCERVA